MWRRDVHTASITAEAGPVGNKSAIQEVSNLPYTPTNVEITARRDLVYEDFHL